MITKSRISNQQYFPLFQTLDFGMDVGDVWEVMQRMRSHTELSSPLVKSLAEQSGDPNLTVEPSRDARPAVVGRRPVSTSSVPLVALV